MQRIKALLGTFGACALLAAVWLLGMPGPESGAVAPPRPTSGPVATSQSQLRPRIADAAVADKGDADTQRPGMNSTDSLRRGLASAPNLRVYVREAMQRPELGGYYYAARAIQHCGLLPTVVMVSVDKKHESKVAAKKSLELELARCEGVTAQFGDVLQFSENLSRRHDRERDPLRTVNYKLARDAYAEPTEAISAALATAEPELLLYALVRKGQAIIEREGGQKFEWTAASSELAAMAYMPAVNDFFQTPALDMQAHMMCLTVDECLSESAELDRRLADPRDRKEYEHYKAVLDAFLSKLRRSTPG